MLIDINAYIGHWPFRQLKYNTCAALLDRMNTFGVNVSVISSLHGVFYKNTQSANQELYDEIKSMRKYSDRFVPFAVINPIYAGWREDLAYSITKLGMKGVRVYPQYHDYPITEPLLVELVQRARDLDVPVAFATRMVDSRQRSWMDIDYVVGTPKPEWALKDIFPIIKAVPDARFIMLNPANSLQLEPAAAAIFKNADVIMDTSGRSLTDLGSLLKTQGTGRFAFGTHSPLQDYLTGQLRLESLRDTEADPATRELLRSGNAKRMLRI